MARGYTFLKLAEEVLLAAKKPVTSKEAWEIAVQRGYDKKLGSQGLTPWDSLNARLIVDTRDNQHSPFVRLDGRPAKFSLKNATVSEQSIQQFNRALNQNGDSTDEEVDGEDVVTESHGASVRNKSSASKYPYLEGELHPFLSWFAKWSLGAVLTKTISHQKSSKQYFSEWLHPDIVGFWFPFSEYNHELVQLAGSGLSLARFYSFEMKRELVLGNLRESFFQAVSNSSWAHEGYLAAPNIDPDERFRRELRRLSGSFGIGVIELNLENIETSEIICPPKRKSTLDWDGANKLAVENPVFRKFLLSARTDIMNNQILHIDEYDSVLQLAELQSKWEAWQKKP